MKSIKAFEAAFVLYEEQGNSALQSSCLLNLGLSYSKLFFMSGRKDQRYIDRAIKLYEDSMEGTSMKDNALHIANAHDCLGDAFYQLAILQNDLDIARSSISSYDKSMEIFKANDNLERCTEIEEKRNNAAEELERCLAEGIETGPNEP